MATGLKTSTAQLCPTKKKIKAMKNVFKLLLSLALSVLFFSCELDKDRTPAPGDNPGTPNKPTGAVTPVGTPEGTPVTASIGPAGGTIQSADQRIQISIPAGALSSTQTISVQPISNHCPAGEGQAFRLSPHGITFAKPATITFQYGDADVNGSAPEFMGIAYQNDKGIWQSPPVRGIDTTAHTVTVQTTHFSDWGLFQKMFIYPERTILNPGANVHLKVFMTVELEDNEDDLLVPLPTLLSTKYIEKWTLAGAGTLTHMHNEGDYYAPASIPVTNPAMITVFLNKSATIGGQVFKDLRLLTSIFVAPEGLSVQVNGGDWTTYTGGAIINGTQNLVTGKNGAETASVGWKGQATGVFRWTSNTDVAFNLIRGSVIYQHMYIVGPRQPPVISGGYLKTDDSDEEWAIGTFNLQPAGWINPSTPLDSYGTATIRGVYRMKRVKGN